MTVYSVELGALGIPMPEQRKGFIGRKVQGGLPPVPYRSCTHKWGSGTTLTHRNAAPSRASIMRRPAYTLPRSAGAVPVIT